MLLTDYEGHIGFLECMPSSTKLGVQLDLKEDIRDVLPYLNARVEDGYLDPEGATLQFNSKGKLVVVQAHRVAMASFEDRAEAESAIAWIVALINETWQVRGRLTPLFRRKPKVQALAVLRNLPRTNCGDCGQPSCMAFAVQLIAKKVSAAECPALGEPDWAEAREGLLVILEDAGQDRQK